MIDGMICGNKNSDVIQKEQEEQIRERVSKLLEITVGNLVL